MPFLKKIFIILFILLKKTVLIYLNRSVNVTATHGSVSGTEIEKEITVRGSGDREKGRGKERGSVRRRE